jgi:hypothetical protein
MRIRFYLILIFILSSNYVFCQKKTFICINEKHDILFSFESNYIWPFSDNLALFKTYTEVDNEKIWRAGFIDTTGKIAISPIYDSRNVSKYGFKNGVSWVKQHKDSMYILIDKKGKIISQKSYEDVGRFNNGICAVFNNNKMGFVNNKGEEIIPCRYIGDTEFYEELAFVCEVDNNNNKYGFINEKGKTILPFIYDKHKDSKFKNGECVVVINGKTNIIDKSGEIVFTPTASNNIKGFSNGLALSYIEKNGKILYGFLNRNNEWAISPQYDKANSFINNRAIVNKNGRYGVIDSEKNEIIPIIFDKITGNCNSLTFFSCLKNGKYSFLDCNGRPLVNDKVNMIKIKYNNKIFPFRDNNNKWGYLTHDGSTQIEPQYDFADHFSEGKAWIY